MAFDCRSFSRGLIKEKAIKSSTKFLKPPIIQICIYFKDLKTGFVLRFWQSCRSDFETMKLMSIKYFSDAINCVLC